MILIYKACADNENLIIWSSNEHVGDIESTIMKGQNPEARSNGKLLVYNKMTDMETTRAFMLTRERLKLKAYIQVQGCMELHDFDETAEPHEMRPHYDPFRSQLPSVSFAI